MFDWWDDFKDWLFDVLMYVPKKVWEWILDAVAAVLEAIPVPDFVQNAGGFFNGLPSGVAWVAEPFQITTGISIVLGAYAIRFLIRRTPLVG